MCSLINAYACTSKHLYGISSSETWQKPNQGPFALFLEFTHFFVFFKYPTLDFQLVFFKSGFQIVFGSRPCSCQDFQIVIIVAI